MPLKQLSLVGDLVGTGIILSGQAPTAKFRNIEFAVIGSQVSLHTGPAHPIIPLTAIIAIGSDTMSVGGKGVAFIGDIASCGCPIVMGSQLPPTERDTLTFGA